MMIGQLLNGALKQRTISGTKGFIMKQAVKYGYKPEDLVFTIRLNEQKEPRVAMYHKNDFVAYIPPEEIINSFI